jgi:hypothetical protein
MCSVAKFVSIWYGSFGNENINDHNKADTAAKDVWKVIIIF